MNDARWRVVASLPCPGCGYDLKGLDSTSACPECGEPVVAVRDHLSFATPGERASVQRGATLVWLAMFGVPSLYAVALAIELFSLPVRITRLIDRASLWAPHAVVAASVVSATVGWIWVAGAARRLGADARETRPAVRAAVGFGAAALTVAGVAALANLVLSRGLGGMMLGAVSALWFYRTAVCLPVAAGLCRRAGAPKSARSAAAWRRVNLVAAGLCAAAVPVVSRLDPGEIPVELLRAGLLVWFMTGLGCSVHTAVVMLALKRACRRAHRLSTGGPLVEALPATP